MFATECCRRRKLFPRCFIAGAGKKYDDFYIYHHSSSSSGRDGDDAASETHLISPACSRFTQRKRGVGTWCGFGSRLPLERQKSEKSNFWRIKPTKEMLIWSFRFWDQHKHGWVRWLPMLNFQGVSCFRFSGMFRLKKVVCLLDKAIMSFGFIFMATGIRRRRCLNASVNRFEMEL